MTPWTLPGPFGSSPRQRRLRPPSRYTGAFIRCAARTTFGQYRWGTWEAVDSEHPNCVVAVGGGSGLYAMKRGAA